MITVWNVRALLASRGVTADEDREDFLMRDLSKGAGSFIAIWDEAKLGPKPSKADLNTFQVEADALRAEAEAKKPDNLLRAAIADAIKDEPANSSARKLGEAFLTSEGRIIGRPV